VSSCTAESGEHEIELRPFALHGDAKQAYYGMVARAQRAAQSRALRPVRMSGQVSRVAKPVS
jgi:hypothetical protein